jgi:hypothetical protein
MMDETVEEAVASKAPLRMAGYNRVRHSIMPR